MPYFEIPALDGSGKFPNSVNQAIADSAPLQALKTGAETVAKGYTDTLREDMNWNFGRYHAAASALPTTDRVPGRDFFRTTNKTKYAGDTTTWLPIATHSDITMASFMSLASGFTLDNAVSNYVVRDGVFINFRVRVSRTSGSFTHGLVFMTIAALYIPWGTGATPIGATQSGGTGTASTVAGNINDNGQVSILTPTGSPTIMEVFGRYRYTP